MVLVGAWFGVQAWIGHEITRLLEREPINLEGGTYAAKVKKTRVNLARRSVTLTGVSVTTPHPKKSSPAPVLKVSVSRVVAAGIHYRREDGDSVKTLSVRSLEVESPEVAYEGVPAPAEDSAGGISRNSASGRKFRIGEVSLKNGNINVGIWKGQQKESLSVAELDMSVDDISSLRTLAGGVAGSLAALPGENSARGGMPRIYLAADSIAYTFKNGAMKLTADTLAYDSADQTFSAAAIALLPQYSKYQYSLRVPDHSDWTQLAVTDVECRGVKLSDLPERELFRADSISVGGVSIDSYKDRNQPQSMKVKPTLYESVQRIPVGIAIPLIEVRGINIRYEEVSKGASVPGIITFTDMDARIEGLTNRPTEEAQHYTIDARGYLLGSALVDTTLSLPADSLDNSFSIRATVGPMSATIATPVTEPIANVRIVAGEIQSVAVEISGNSYRAQSVVDMRYTDLRIAIMRKNDPDREREFITAIANDIVLRRNNPQGDRLRIGHGTYERDPYKSFWNYIWKTAFAGVADVIM